MDSEVVEGKEGVPEETDPPPPREQTYQETSEGQGNTEHQTETDKDKTSEDKSAEEIIKDVQEEDTLPAEQADQDESIVVETEQKDPEEADKDDDVPVPAFSSFLLSPSDPVLVCSTSASLFCPHYEESVPYTKGAKISPDGLCVLASSSDDKLRLVSTIF